MDFLKVAVVILYIVLTILTIKIHPGIHQPMVLEDADFKLTRISDTLITKNIPMVTSQPQQKTVSTPATTTIQTPAKTVEVKVTEPTVTTKTVQVTQPQTQTVQKPIKIPKYAQNQQQEITLDNQQQELLEQIIKIAQQELGNPEVVEKLVEKPAQKPQQSQQIQQPVPKQPSRCEQEEIIAWNKWRSAIHNQIMKDSGAGTAPLGSIFQFSFLVDKYGNVSNIKTSCIGNGCMEIARTGVKSAISNLHRKPILEFPKNTHRTSVVVSGQFLIGMEDRFSTPSNFSDIERITH